MKKTDETHAVLQRASEIVPRDLTVLAAIEWAQRSLSSGNIEGAKWRLEVARNLASEQQCAAATTVRCDTEVVVSSLPSSTELSFTIPQFCAAYHFSRVYYYTLKAQGKAPQELRIGRRVVITRKAVDEWANQQGLAPK